MYEMEKVETDKGWLINLNKDTISFDIKHSYIGTISPGKERGDHYHKETKERFICIKGIISVILKDDDFFDLEAGDFVDIEPGTHHKLMNISEEEVYFICLTDKVMDKKLKDTFKEE